MTVALISSQELSQRVAGGLAGWSIVDARTAGEFDAGHIPGAVSVAWEQWCEAPPAGSEPILSQPGFWGLLADPVANEFCRRLSRAGIGGGEPVVVYADGARSKGREGRVAWMLLYLGASCVYLLDGGWSGWLAGGGEIELCRQSSRPPAEFALSVQEHRRVRLPQLQELYRSNRMPLMIDTRTDGEFRGHCYDYQPRKGRLPRSVLVPFSSLFLPGDRFITRERYLEIIPPGLADEPYAVAYCEVGVRAATFALLHEMYTGCPMPVFDGSIMEWAWHTALPILV